METTLRGWKPWPGGRWLIFAAPALPCPRQATATDGRPSSKHFIIAPNRVSQTTFGDLQPSEARAGNHATTLGWSWGKKRGAMLWYGSHRNIQFVPFHYHNVEIIFTISLRNHGETMVMVRSEKKSDIGALPLYLH